MAFDTEKNGFCSFGQKGDALCYRYEDERVIIEPWGENSLRVRAYRTREMPAEDWALLPPAKCSPTIKAARDGGTIANGRIRAEINAIGKICFFNEKGDVLLEEYWRNHRDMRAPTCSALNISARELQPRIGGDYSITARFVSASPEKLFGMGQYQQRILNLKGARLELAQRNSQASVPFVLSDRGYGFLWNNPAIGCATFGTNVTTWEAYDAKGLDYWITAGNTPAQIEEAYAAATGTAPMMPEYGLGLWQCKLRYQTQEELLQVAREYKRRGVQPSVIVVDYFHWPKQGDWRFDPAYWPNPDAMIAELRAMGIELMVSVWPTVDDQSENYKEMRARGLLIRQEKGVPVSMTCLGNTLFFDATNPEARQYVWDKVKANYYDKGVGSFWLDVAEPEYTAYDFDNYRYYIGTNAQIGNIYPMLYAKTFYDGMRAAGQERVVNLIRCAWAGSQRYGALVWSGDIVSSFSSMRDQISAGLNMAIAGIPWWTTDIGGFDGGDIRDPAFHELLIRWFEYAVFSPVLRMHGNRLPQQPQQGTTGGAACLSGAPNEIWSYGERVYTILSSYIALRERMRPYIRSLMRAAHEKGTPVMRPLFYEFPEDAACWDVEDAYLFGPSVLVKPVASAGCAETQVYLPQGAEWTDAWTRERVAGGRWVTTATPTERIPLFTRDDFELPVQA